MSEEQLEFCQQGYWTVLPLTTVLDWQNLRLSPLDVVPQRNRRPRLIVDNTFSRVNDETVRLAPPEAMQIGRTLQRVLTSIAHAKNPRYGPPKLAKIDIADGLYRVWVHCSDTPKLGVVLLCRSGIPLIAFPLALPIGWVESPPYFTILTETGASSREPTWMAPGALLFGGHCQHATSGLLRGFGSPHLKHGQHPIYWRSSGGTTREG